MNSFFIIGVGRSGTSLLQSILSSHSKIAIPPETGFVRHNLLSWQKSANLTVKNYLKKNDKLGRVDGIWEKYKGKEYQTDRDFYSCFLERYVERKGKSIAGDKDPRLVEFIDAVSDLFPNAKFIHLVRDPRDVLLSKKKAEWSKGKPNWYHIFANYLQLKMGERQGQNLPEDQYLLITYESLLAAPENTIEKLCTFLDVEFEESMLSFQDKAKELISEKEKQWKKETMGPLLKDNTGKWKGELNDKEIALTELLCKQAFSIGKYEYNDAFSRLSLFKKCWVYALAAILKGSGFFFMLYQLISQRILVKWKF